jgi:maleylpyruvate isomerase
VLRTSPSITAHTENLGRLALNKRSGRRSLKACDAQNLGHNRPHAVGFPIRRAHVRALAAIVGCDIHPINNRRILQTLRKQFGANEDAVNAWCGHWISEGFDAYEALIGADKTRGRFSFGDTPTLADAYLIPQVESARRFKVDLTQWPHIMAVEKACMELEAFQKAAPGQQPDAG